MMLRFIKPVLLTVSLLFTTPMLVAEPLTQNQLHATMGIVTNYILDDNSIRFHGKSYAPITSPHTGRVWLDRNIGANQKCTSFEDAPCYGDYFQWGRGMDGHQNSIDSTTVLATDINNAGTEFVRGTFDWTIMDLSYGNTRATNWLKIDGSSVCPVGYRVPLRDELDAEVGDISNKETAYANFLKFPAAGYRNFVNANYLSMGTWGTVWSASSTKSMASYFRFWSISNWKIEGERAWGLSVRCIKHVGKPLIYHNTTTYSTVTSPYTGKVWLDRNLGASQVCTAFNDTACYGDYYQWGRSFDGHQDSGSANFNVFADDITTVGHGNFILSPTAPNDWTEPGLDDSGELRSANMSYAIDGFVCPIGFRVPYIGDLKAELTDSESALISNHYDAFNSFLKLPSNGHRGLNGVISAQGEGGYLWANDRVLNGGNGFFFRSTQASRSSARRAFGRAIRCLVNWI